MLERHEPQLMLGVPWAEGQAAHGVIYGGTLSAPTPPTHVRDEGASGRGVRAEEAGRVGVGRGKCLQLKRTACVQQPQRIVKGGTLTLASYL